MYQKDFILRMIEMMGDLIAALMGRIRKGEFPKATEMLDNLYHDLLKEDAAFFRAIPQDQLTVKLIQEHHYTNGHLQILAELFYAEAELRYAQGMKTVSAEFYAKSLHLLEFLNTASRTFSIEQQDRMKAIQSRLLEVQTL
ncbi:MAG TPA: hypothetical protein VHO72_01760 [Bacteroidales bacterium]|nr:hypothetical protein [Bacteroidales bacterium]